jgi:hypothetical protein
LAVANRGQPAADRAPSWTPSRTSRSGQLVVASGRPQGVTQADRPAAGYRCRTGAALRRARRSTIRYRRSGARQHDIESGTPAAAGHAVAARSTVDARPIPELRRSAASATRHIRKPARPSGDRRSSRGGAPAGGRSRAPADAWCRHPERRTAPLIPDPRRRYRHCGPIRTRRKMRAEPGAIIEPLPPTTRPPSAADDGAECASNRRNPAFGPPMRRRQPAAGDPGTTPMPGRRSARRHRS